MLNVDIVKAESCFSDLIAQSIGGKEIVITRCGQPLVKFVALTWQKRKRCFGSAKGQVKMFDDFDNPLVSAMLAYEKNDNDNDNENLKGRIMAKVEHFPISQFTFAQKLNLMETIWDELTVDDKKLESPKWHEEVLMDREVAMKAGKISVSEWEDAKTRIRRNVLC